MSGRNGTPSYRIWVVGTRRILGVSEGRFAPSGYKLLPSPLPESLDEDMDYFGDFKVCPFQADTPGSMRLVCVAEVTNLYYRRRGK